MVSTNSGTLSASSTNNYLELIEYANNCSFNVPRYWSELHDIFNSYFVYHAKVEWEIMSKGTGNLMVYSTISSETSNLVTNNAYLVETLPQVKRYEI